MLQAPEPNRDHWRFRITLSFLKACGKSQREIIAAAIKNCEVYIENSE